MNQSFERETGLLDGVPRLLRFAISTAALEHAIPPSLVTERGKPPPVESSSEESSSSSDEAVQLASPVQLRHGRKVKKQNYRE